MATTPDISGYIGVNPPTDFELTQIVEKGIPLESLESLKEKGLTSTEISQLVIPARTLKHRKGRGQNLSREETERLLRVGRVLSFAEYVFGNRTKSLHWLRRQDDRLGDRTRLSLMATEAGGRLIEAMLWQIADGVYT
jgi:putative toxin-antitoxin system antitoxin component (TIGR02293 family)